MTRHLGLFSKKSGGKKAFFPSVLTVFEDQSGVSVRQGLANDVSQRFQSSVHLGCACASLLNSLLMPEFLQLWTECAQLIDALGYQRIPFNICQSDISQNLKTLRALPLRLTYLCCMLS